jgi:replication factor C small subunit
MGELMVEKYRPRRIEDFRGLADNKKILAKFVKGPYPSNWLFVGPPGVGKTAMGRALFEAIHGRWFGVVVPPVHISSKRCDLVAVNSIAKDLYFRGDHHYIIDEANLMTRDAQNRFLSLMDGSEIGRPNAIFIFTCNETSGLEHRFLDRCQVLQFRIPPSNDLVPWIQDIWHQETGNVLDFAVAVKWIRDCNSVPRTLLTRLQKEMMLSVAVG